MLPFSDIDFFLFATFYVLIIWLCKFIVNQKYYSLITFFITLFYIVFYYKYSVTALLFFASTFLFIRFLSSKINHRLITALIIAIPLILIKVHLQPSLIYFAGLSFVTFRAIQVNIDYKKDEPLSPLLYFNFLFFIPALYIGPLDRFKRFTDNCAIGFTSIQSQNIIHGLQELLKGILYKYILAEIIYRYFLTDVNQPELSKLELLKDIYTYTLYLFFDFAGYSSMAVGLAYLLGITLPFNFNKPFLAVNPPDLWHRWHATLTSWLTDYVFKPLYQFLSQQKKLKKYPLTKQNIVIFFTLFTMGIWNGLEPNFIWSGIIYGTYSVIHNCYVMACRKKDKDVFFGNISPNLKKYFSIFIMFNLVCLALYVFSGRNF